MRSICHTLHPASPSMTRTNVQPSIIFFITPHAQRQIAFLFSTTTSFFRRGFLSKTNITYVIKSFQKCPWKFYFQNRAHMPKVVQFCPNSAKKVLDRLLHWPCNVGFFNTYKLYFAEDIYVDDVFYEASYLEARRSYVR
jgi:hypothetical protein